VEILLLVAAIAAAIGIAVFQFIIDRPKLKIELNYEVSLGPSSVFVRVTNLGRRGTTLREAGLAAGCDLEFENLSIPAPNFKSRPRLRLGGASHSDLEAGRTRLFTLILTEWPAPWIHADLPLRAYAMDSRGRLLYGPCAPVMRRLLNRGWKPPVGTSAGVLTPQMFEMEPVYPAWKVWKPKSQRARLRLREKWPFKH
jgi:hypothetical protein